MSGQLFSQLTGDAYKETIANQNANFYSFIALSYFIIWFCSFQTIHLSCS